MEVEWNLPEKSENEREETGGGNAESPAFCERDVGNLVHSGEISRTGLGGFQGRLSITKSSLLFTKSSLLDGKGAIPMFR